MDVEHKTIDVAYFEANCTKIIEDLDHGTMSAIDITRDGKVVAILRPERKSAHGCHEPRLLALAATPRHTQLSPKRPGMLIAEKYSCVMRK